MKFKKIHGFEREPGDTWKKTEVKKEKEKVM